MADDLTKSIDELEALAKTADAKPPSGFSPVPGSAHGGYRKMGAGGYEYWYPSKEAASADAKHHEDKASAKHALIQTYQKGGGTGTPSPKDREKITYHEQGISEHKEAARGAAKFAAGAASGSDHDKLTTKTSPGQHAGGYSVDPGASIDQLKAAYKHHTEQGRKFDANGKQTPEAVEHSGRAIAVHTRLQHLKREAKGGLQKSTPSDDPLTGARYLSRLAHADPAAAAIVAWAENQG